MTFTIPKPDWGQDNENLIAERGEWFHFEMFTKQGNDACVALIEALVTRVETDSVKRDEAVNWLKNGITILAMSHPEVHDTEPEWAIVDAVNAFFDTQGWVHIERGDL
jgi:hypothetical protein